MAQFFAYRPRRSRTSAAPSRRRPFARPALELLEQRCLLATGFLQGTAFIDAGLTQTLTSKDPYLAGATISLYQGTTVSQANFVATTTTNSNGQYFFGNLNPGTYTLVETPPSGFRNDATQVLSQFNPATSVNASTIQATVLDPSNVYLAFDANLFFNRNAWDFLQETVNTTTDTETAGQFPVAPVNPFAFTQQFSNAGVTHFSSTVSMTNTSGFSPGQFVKVTDGTTTLYSMITKVTANSSIALDDQWGGSTGTTATVSALTDLNPADNTPATGEYLALCWDLQNFLNDQFGPPPVTVTNLFQVTPTSGQSTPANAGQIAYLFNHYATVDIKNAAADNSALAGANVTPPSLPTGTTAEAVGLQIAVWELEYGTNFNALQVLQTTSGGTMAKELSDINTWANFYVHDSAGKSETATFLQANGTFLQLGNQGMIATGSLNFGNLGSPSLTTSASETANGVVGSAVLSDKATLSGGYNVAAGSPAPTMTFNLIAPNGSTAYTETQTVTGTGTYSTTGTGTGSELANQVGTYYWVVSYSGNTLNNSVTDNGQNQPSEQLTVTPAAPQLTTSASETANGVVGTAVLSDTATLSGGYQVAAGSPAPTITFTLVAPNGSTVYTETRTVTGTGNYTTTGTGTGSDVATQVGTYYWNVAYSGNAFNTSVSHNGQNDTAEQLTTTPATPSLTTQGSETANEVVGTAVLSDTATLSGGFMVAAGSPAPTLTFELFAPNGTQVYTETQTVTGAGNYTTTGTGTGSELATQVGTYYWDVSYTGNAFNSSVTHSGQNDTHEQLTTTPATPALSTQGSETANGVVGTAVLSDTATLSGGFMVAAGSPAPTLTFTLVAPNGSTVYTETQTVTGTGNYSTTGTGTGSELATQVGTYYWNVSYSGNTFNNSVTHSGQNDTNEQLTTTQATPSLTTQGSETANGVVGTAVLSDTATLSGGFMVAAGSPAPTLTFTLIAPNGSTAYTETQTVTGTGNYTTTGSGTGSELATQVGTYYWDVSYSGNAFNTSVSHSGQTDTAEQLTTTPATPSLTTQGSETANGTVGTAVLSDTATLSGGFMVATGSPAPTLTFTLIAPNGSTAYTETQTVTGTGSYTTTGTGSGSDVATQVGTYYWNVSYSGNAFNSSVSHSGQTDSHEQLTTTPATPALTTQGSETANGVVGSAVLSDTATLSGGFMVAAGSPAPTLTFTLIAPNGSTVYTETQTVTGTGNYTTTGTGTGSELATQVGTYYWVVTYSGNTLNSSVTDNGQNQPNEQLTTTPATPALTTQGSETANGVVGSAVLSDTATLSGGYMVAAGSPAPTLTFTLIAPNGTTAYTETQTVTGTGNYTTTGSGSGSELATQVGTYYWTVSYSGNTFITAVTHNGQNDTHEQLAVIPATPQLATTPSMTQGSNGAVMAGEFATIGFWNNQNGQAVINSFNGSSSSTALGNWLASTFPNLFGAANPYTGTSLAGLTNAQVAAVYQSLWTPSGLTKNTYVQAFAAALGVYADTISLGGQSLINNGLASQYGFVVSAGGGSATFNVGSNGASFGVANGTSLTVSSILTTLNNNFSPTTGLFYGGDQTKTSAANNVVDGINSVGDIPGNGNGLSGNGSSVLNDSATLSGGDSPTGTITFYLFAPGATASTPLSSAVYTDTVTVSGDGTYTTAGQGNHASGFVPTATGTYQWVAIYSGDTNNSGVTCPFGSEPFTVGAASPTLNTFPGGNVVLGSGAKLTDSAVLAAGSNPTGTITFYLFAPGVTPNSSNSNNVYSDTVTVNGNGTYSTATGNHAGGYVPTVTGTYQWIAVYSGDANNAATSDAFGNEPETVNSSNGISSGDFATIGFWHNQNGQAVINSFNGSSSSTALGKWLATNFPNLFGAANPYTGKSLSGLTNAQVAAVYSSMWTPSGVTKNTYVQAFAVALGIYATTSSLGGSAVSQQYGFRVTTAGSGNDLYTIGSNAPAFGGTSGSITVLQILKTVNNNFSPSTGQFYAGDQTKTSDANNVLNGINTAGDIQNAVASPGGIVYTPSQIRSAYGVSQLALDGTGQTVAIVVAYDDPAIYQALDSFDSQFSTTTGGPTLYQQYGQAASFLTVLNQQGQTTSLPTTDPSGVGTNNWELEAALDAEWVHAMAPGAHIVLVEANSSSLSDLMTGVATAANLPGVSVVSMSWGLTEGQSVLAADEALYDSYLTTPAGHQGVTFVASTGDFGSYNPEYPAFSPYVVAVGGTSLYLNSDNSYNSETGWGYFSNADGTFVGSGGGASQFEPEPYYQQGAQSTGYRSAPDVALVADPATGAWVSDPYNAFNGDAFGVVGGTSLSAPAWAGLFALANQGRVAAGETTFNTSSPTQAQEALYKVSANDYHSITSGTNGGYTASAGYNMVTGLGTPVANLLIPDLVNYTAPGAPAGTLALPSGGSGGSGSGNGTTNVLRVSDPQATTAHGQGPAWGVEPTTAASAYGTAEPVFHTSVPAASEVGSHSEAAATVQPSFRSGSLPAVSTGVLPAASSGTTDLVFALGQHDLSSLLAGGLAGVDRTPTSLAALANQVGQGPTFGAAASGYGLTTAAPRTPEATRAASPAEAWNSYVTDADAAPAAVLDARPVPAGEDEVPAAPVADFEAADAEADE
jgi:hypothetical protein